MDIFKKLTFNDLKASFEKLKPKQKFYLLVFLLSLVLNLIPHETYAFTIKAPTASEPILVFNLSDDSVENYLEAWSAILTDQYRRQEIVAQAQRQQKLTQKIETYLAARNSPLAKFAPTLVTVKNWKKIIALSNAESTLCRFYPKSTANCWGVGGSDLWDFGNDLHDGIIGMNRFLNEYPKKMSTKYSQMSFERMNGLYKQPPGAHWVFNAKVIYDDLTVIESSL